MCGPSSLQRSLLGLSLLACAAGCSVSDEGGESTQVTSSAVLDASASERSTPGPARDSSAPSAQHADAAASDGARVAPEAGPPELDDAGALQADASASSDAMARMDAATGDDAGSMQQPDGAPADAATHDADAQPADAARAGDGSVQCEFLGGSYRPGAQLPTPVTCGACRCGDDGQARCTGGACDSTCEYHGEVHQGGFPFLSADHCNFCECQPDGGVSCGSEPCGPGCDLDGRHYQQFDTYWNDCNGCVCERDGQFWCTLIGCAED